MEADVSVQIRTFSKNTDSRRAASGFQTLHAVFLHTFLHSLFESLREEAGIPKNPFTGVLTRDGESVFRKPVSVEELALIVGSGEGGPLHLRDLQSTFPWNEANLNPALQRCRNPVEHRERMPVVVGIFQPRNHGLGGADPAGEFCLRNPGFVPELEDFLRNFAIGDFLLKHALHLRLLAGDVGQDFERVGGLLRHFQFLR